MSSVDKLCQDTADAAFPFAFEKADLHAGAPIFQNLYRSFLIGGERIPISGENAKLNDRLIRCFCFHQFAKGFLAHGKINEIRGGAFLLKLIFIRIIRCR